MRHLKSDNASYSLLVKISLVVYLVLPARIRAKGNTSQQKREIVVVDDAKKRAGNDDDEEEYDGRAIGEKNKSIIVFTEYYHDKQSQNLHYLEIKWCKSKIKSIKHSLTLFVSLSIKTVEKEDQVKSFV